MINSYKYDEELLKHFEEHIKTLNSSKFVPFYIDPETLKIENVYPDDWCYHEWKTYEGITDKYDYCIKCDVKKDE